MRALSTLIPGPDSVKHLPSIVITGGGPLGLELGDWDGLADGGADIDALGLALMVIFNHFLGGSHFSLRKLVVKSAIRHDRKLKRASAVHSLIAGTDSFDRDGRIASQKQRAIHVSCK